MKLKLCKYVLFFLMITVLLIYLFTNIKLFADESPAIEFLGFFVVLGSALLFLEFYLKKNFCIKKSFFILVLFFSYYIVNILINKTDDLKSFTIATTGGIILFYLMGAIISVNFQFIKHQVTSSRSFLKSFNIFYMALSIVFFSLFFDTFFEMLGKMRKDLFLIEGLDGFYQRSGNFLIISFFIYSIFTFFFIFSNKYYKNMTITSIIFFCIYFSITLLGIFLSQIIGSNNAFICISGILFAGITFYIFTSITKSKQFLDHHRLNYKEIFFSRLTKKLIFSSGITFFIIICFFMVVINYYDINIEKLRFFGNDMASITTRIDALNNFIIHFNNNTMLGNINVDVLKTGEGTYVHSFVLSMLSHMGIIGTIIFFIYLIMATKESIKSYNGFYLNNVFFLYNMSLFLGIFLIAACAVFINWVPLWFLFGMVFPPIKFKQSKIF